ncbi:MAG: LamG domain-containing protein, partial [Planctomycetes bacterium]|nr:LamG domain-containing protein [Planctomycetota bacterium]
PDFRDALVVHLPFDGTLDDASGRHNNASVGGGTPAYAAGLHGSSLALDGLDDWITLGQPADLAFGAGTDYTISLWISADDFQPSGDPAIISNKNWSDGFNDGWGLFMGGDGDDWKVNQAAAGSGGRVDTAWIDVHHTSGTPRFGHIAATFDRDGNVRVYRDGAIIDQAPMEPGDVDGFAVNIGQDGTGVYPHFFEGAIDDLAIWRRTLSADEIAILAMGRDFDDLLADCTADLDGSGDVGFGDILEVIANWGFCPGCPQDLSGNNQVDFADILAVIGAWGPC